jgi:AcrR family transcriptional regulator
MSQLDAGIISRAALVLIGEQGIDGFSIRAVARSLGVTPMALYHHVRDKAALAELVVASVIADHPLAAETGHWRDDLWNVAQCGRAMTLSNPAVATILRIYDIWTPESHAMADRWMRHWQDSGLEPERAILAASTSSAAISGLVAEEKRERECDPPHNRPGLPDLPGAEQLLSTSVDADLRFELGFNAIVDGLLVRLSK